VLTFYGPNARPVVPPIQFRVLFPWFGYSGYKLVVVAASAALLLATWYTLMRTRIGLVMRATHLLTNRRLHSCRCRSRTPLPGRP
jgi:branched-chain amino acid transport system permease protein